MTIRIKLKEEHFRQLVAGGVTAVVVEDDALIHASDFVLRPTVDAVQDAMGK